MGSKRLFIRQKYRVTEGGGSGSGGGSAFFDGSRPISRLPVVGDNYGTTTVSAFLEAAYFPFVGAALSLSNPGLQEKGLIGGVTLNFSATVTPRSETVFSNGRIDRISPAGQVATFTAAPGTQAATPVNGVTATAQYIARIDVGGNGTPGTVSSLAQTVSFFAPTYYGVGAAGLNEAQIKALTKRIRAGGNDLNLSFSPANQRYYYAYPAAFGLLSAIIDPNGFDFLAAFTRQTVNFTLPDGTAESYHIYVSNSDTAQSNYLIDFIF